MAAELSRRGYIASITLRNTRGVDILASNADATKSVGIQVKTSQASKPSWVLNEKVEQSIGGALATPPCRALNKPEQQHPTEGREPPENGVPCTRTASLDSPVRGT